MPEPIPFQARNLPPDDAQRRRALDPARSFIVQAPAGSGKTYLLTQRFLRLLALAERPDEIIAITFTIAAAAEMRNRVLEALEAAERMLTAGTPPDPHADPLSVASLARRAILRSHEMGWQLLDQPGQLRIMTIDAFCRSIAMQTPLSWGFLSGLGSLDTTDRPDDLYRRAARRVLDRVATSPSAARDSVEALLLWRDNNWHDVENQIVEMLRQRNRWYQDFVFARDHDFTLLRRRLEAPMRRAAHHAVAELCSLLHSFPGACDDLLAIARTACGNCENPLLQAIAERAELPYLMHGDEIDAHALEDAVEAFRNIASFLLTKTEKSWRKRFDVSLGFPPGALGKPLKAQIESLLNQFRAHPSLESALAAFLDPQPIAYTDDEWTIIRHSFVILREAYAELQLVFAESGLVDFIEIAQIAQRILTPSEETSFDFALRLADQIRHLLVDEFQDTSRNQHQLLARLIAAWPESAGRTCFCVGDPMQSIYGFREAEVELFERLKSHGLDLPGHAAPFHFEYLTLQANFRTVPTLIEDLNQHFEKIFPAGSIAATHDDVRFAPAKAVRPASPSASEIELHLDFTLSSRSGSDSPHGDPAVTRQAQLDRIVSLIRTHLAQAQAARRADSRARYRIAVLGRRRAALVPVAEALRNAGIPFRAVDLVPLRERSEILDALALTRALMNPADRRAWLGVLRAPWCGLSLAELHQLVSADDAEILATPVPVLLATRLPSLAQSGALSSASAASATRVARILHQAQNRRAEASTFSLGTWLESVWKSLGGTSTVDAEAQANLRLLWQTLDSLPAGELDLLGPALDSALKGLFALPHPATTGDFGVQLMTIHQSKGLEFEIVIVPELESSTRPNTPSMISWLERGLAGSEQTEPGEGPTEFLIAPIQSKGSDASAARSWVDRVKREREGREMRRLLYVASTRAREELHLFARPLFNAAKGAPVLAKPCGLLETAWPAIEDRVQTAFQQWLSDREPAPIPAIAAQAELFVLPAPTRLYRLPETVAPPDSLLRNTAPPSDQDSPADSPLAAYERTVGGLASRLAGVVIHAFLEELARLRHAHDQASAHHELGSSVAKITMLLRSRGLSQKEAGQLAQEALAIARQVLNHPIGAWILHPHPQSAVETRWTGLVRSQDASSLTLRHLRPDRVFFAAPHAGSGPAAWWIIDYKTSHAHIAPGQPSNQAEQQAFLASHREQHQAQLAAYAQLLRGLVAQNSDAPATIYAGLFYPRLLLLDAWSL